MKNNVMNSVPFANVKHAFGEDVRLKNEVIVIKRKNAYSQILSVLLSDRCEHNRFMFAVEEYDGHEAEYQEIMARVRATLIALRNCAPKYVSR